MTTQRLPERALLYWRIRLLIGCLIPALLGGFLYYTAAKFFTILTLIWMAVFVLLCFVYYPMYHHCYSYSVGGKQIRVSRGVVYSQTDVVYVRNLQYTTLSQTPLQRLMDLATLRLHAAGGVVQLYCIPYEEARLLRIQLGKRWRWSMQQATTIKRFRSHPLYIVSILWKYLFILLVPVIRGLYYVIINSFSLENGFQFAVNISNWAKGAWMDIVFLLAFLSLGVLLWLSFTIEVSEEGLLIKRGVLKREVRFLPVSRYNCLSVVSPMSVRLFGGVYLRVDTPGGGLKQADLLMLLRTKDCRQIIKLLQLPDSLEQPAHTRSYTPKNRYVFVLAMVTSNSFAGVLLISTFVTQAGNILGEQFSEMLYGTFENVTRTLAFGVPPAAFALACILFFGYLCAFVVSLSRHANFHVIRRKNLLEVRAGLLTKRSYRIAADKIAYLDIRRSLLTCLLGVYSIFLSTVGYGKFKDDVSALIPCVRKNSWSAACNCCCPNIICLKGQQSRTVCGQPEDISGVRQRCWDWFGQGGGCCWDCFRTGSN